MKQVFNGLFYFVVPCTRGPLCVTEKMSQKNCLCGSDLITLKKQPHRKPSLSKMKFPLRFCELARFFREKRTLLNNKKKHPMCGGIF